MALLSPQHTDVHLWFLFLCKLRKSKEGWVTTLYSESCFELATAHLEGVG